MSFLNILCSITLSILSMYLWRLGIVIKYENMSYKTALHHANQVLGLAGKASKYIKELFDAPDVSFVPRELVS